ncbi:carbohydrate ABC transporter permease [Enterococcus lactis]|jgi:ABC-type glycerol-3-phosphate transport system permease component|uniref:carbohydrate ABC transporter permease n=1 Tax=Enterococcus TaxID=1350 RepID=UPI0001CEDD1F|nr:MULTISPECIES: carbohydrate ABC transporter permease [Enterococcus]MBR8695862.1 carbohydrate ABC transporter permease [Enterococcus gallinarum]AWX48701.1 carbohydrate ABC transporter permease [Enterococcus faecium]EFF60607.1 ABC transporter, permease protein [Enterococcus faecium PC4.1]EGP4714260.1 carbohydrate ABC transporter permease [Enterococcus faecium]EGP4719877.1 carbohydrate ABC transporter permease [Enterococcus faecium]
MDKHYRLQRLLIYGFMLLLTFLSIFPFWVVLMNSTRSAEQIQQGLSLLPGTQLAANWHVLRNKGFDVFNGFQNSLVISAGATLLNVYFSALTAYGLIAYRFKGKRLAFAVILGLIMIPQQISMIGFYQFMNRLDLLNSYIPLIFPAIASPTTVFFLKQYLETVYHSDLADSARLDGAGELKIFHKVMLPLMKPGLATMAIFSFVTTWNNFLMPLILINDTDKFTLPMLIQLLKTDVYRTEFGSMYLGISLSIAPLLLIYLFLSKYIIGGVTAGGIKE